MPWIMNLHKIQKLQKSKIQISDNKKMIKAFNALSSLRNGGNGTFWALELHLKHRWNLLKFKQIK